MSDSRLREKLVGLKNCGPTAEALFEEIVSAIEDQRFLTNTLQSELAALREPSAFKVGGVTGIALITAERAAQITKHGYDARHDSEHDGSAMLRPELVRAAAHILDESNLWPWSDTLGPIQKGYCRIHQLKVAGALIAAEIDRLIVAGETDFEGQPSPPTPQPIKVKSLRELEVGDRLNIDDDHLFTVAQTKGKDSDFPIRWMNHVSFMHKYAVLGLIKHGHMTRGGVPIIWEESNGN